MDFRQYLDVARSLEKGTTEGDWRSAISRAYYAAFHVARELLEQLGFHVPWGERAHAYLWLRLANSGDLAVQRAGSRLSFLRGERNKADYDYRSTFSQATASRHVRMAEQIIQALDAALQDPVRTQITDAMKVYERDILKDVTWHP